MAGSLAQDAKTASVIWYQNRFEVLAHAACEAPITGLVLEFGVASGTTINFLANTYALRGRHVFGFDSFRGLPEAWASYPAGHFACEPPTVASNVTLVVGLFAETIPPFLENHKGACALIHIDCDLYSSTMTVLEMLADRIVSGTIIALDEFWIMTEHEQRAFREWASEHGRKFRHVCRSIEQAVVMME